MASQEKPEARKKTPTGVTINVNAPTAPSDSKSPRTQRTPQQSENPPGDVTPGGAPEIPSKPIHRRTQVFHNESGNKLAATPVAATLFARFNPRFNNPQPAEYYTYTDNVYKRRGHI